MGFLIKRMLKKKYLRKSQSHDMHQSLVVKRTTKYLAWKCNAVFASTRIHFISFQGFYREYRAVQGLINDRGHLFRRDTHFILLNVKLFTAKLYIFRRKWWVFIFKVFLKKKQKQKSRPKFFGILRSVAEGKQTYFFFWPYSWAGLIRAVVRFALRTRVLSTTGLLLAAG